MTSDTMRFPTLPLFHAARTSLQYSDTSRRPLLLHELVLVHARLQRSAIDRTPPPAWNGRCASRSAPPRCLAGTPAPLGAQRPGHSERSLATQQPRRARPLRPYAATSNSVRTTYVCNCIEVRSGRPSRPWTSMHRCRPPLALGESSDGDCGCVAVRVRVLLASVVLGTEGGEGVNNARRAASWCARMNRSRPPRTRRRRRGDRLVDAGMAVGDDTGTMRSRRGLARSAGCTEHRLSPARVDREGVGQVVVPREAPVDDDRGHRSSWPSCSRMLAGLTSQWTKPRECAWRSAASTSRNRWRAPPRRACASDCS